MRDAQEVADAIGCALAAYGVKTPLGYDYASARNDPHPNADYAAMANAAPPAPDNGFHRGPCDVCSAQDQVRYQAPIRSTDGTLVRLACCWDCHIAIL